MAHAVVFGFTLCFSPLPPPPNEGSYMRRRSYVNKMKHFMKTVTSCNIIVAMVSQALLQLLSLLSNSFAISLSTKPQHHHIVLC